ncbi:MAG: biotin/lipoyl-binding protein, partial [Lachnospiraceae bacterium]|nr:biotin/lipoyl-binding protein [Lachnospiraceae bacterium]
VQAAKKTAEKAKAPAASGSEGAIKINSPMPGKILSIKTKVGQAVKKGDVVMILEAMKMENEIVAPQDGVIASVNVSEGTSVEAGSVLASLN